METEAVARLADSLFGEDGWECSVEQVDVKRVLEMDGGFKAVVAVVVRFSLRNGVRREDVGFGESGIAGSQVAALDEAEKIAREDGIRRSGRQFGEALGNCLYDPVFQAFMKQIGGRESLADIPQLDQIDLAGLSEERSRNARRLGPIR